MEYDNRNRGALFKNDKATTEKHPGYTGKINVDGVDYYLSAWLKDGSKGKFFSLSVKPVEEKPAAKPKSVMDIPDDDLDSDLPPF